MNAAFEQQQFLDVIDRDDAQRRLRAALDWRPLDAESIPLSEAHGRVLAEDVMAPIDVPGFDRSNVDGFAVRAEDTFGAGEDRLIELRLAPEAIGAGEMPARSVEAGLALAVATGAMIPRGADAVVMIEHTNVRQNVLRLSRPVAPGANITFAGTDIGRGETVLRRRIRLGSRDTGVLAAIGVGMVPVIRRPRVAIISTGGELVPPGGNLRPGQVFDSNSTFVADAVRELGAEAVVMGIIPDDSSALKDAIDSALSCDVVILSGGTSKGAGDVSYCVVSQFGPPGVIAHGVALKPGKPLCLAVVKRPGRRPIPIAVLPGFPTSAMFTFHEFIAPVIRAFAGLSDTSAATINAVLPMRVNSERGRTEYLLVGLIRHGAGYAAYPMGKGSGSVTAFAAADGFITIPRQREYLDAGANVEVQLIDAVVRPADLVVIGSNCTGLDFLLGELHALGVTSRCLAVGSMGGLEAANRGECDIAGIHLLDPDSNRYNEPFLSNGLTLVRGYGRTQGVVFRPGDERFECRTAAEVVARVVGDSQVLMVNRNRGSGTRVLIDRLLRGAKPRGYSMEAKSHQSVVAAIAQGRVDWGVAIGPAASASGMGFIPLQAEQFDFVIPDARRDRPAVRAFVQLLERPTIRAALAARGFADS
jgi:putative molybdopterin biosynthesis protein